MSLAWLIDPQHQFMTKSGTINVGGSIRVFEAVTDDPVLTFKDFSGTENELSVVLDSNGRANVIADPSKAYRVEVYDRYGTLMWTAGPVWCLDASGDGATGTEVISSDGSISVVKTVTGGMTQFDISNRVDDSTDLLEWIASSGDSEYHDGAFHLVYNAGTMEIGERGVRLGARRYYHVTAEVTVSKDEVHPVYDNIDFVLYFRDGEGALTEVAKFSRVGDYSMGLSQCWTVACDCMPENDVELVLRVEGKDLDDAGGFTVTRFDVHRVFSGAPALPGGAVSKDMLEEGLAEKQDVIDDLSEIRAGAEAGATAVQPGDLAEVATSGSYNDLSNKPDLSGYATKSEVTSGLASKQDTLIAGNNITIVDNVISATGGGGGGGTTYTAGEGINIQNDEISVDTSVIQEKLTAGSNITISGTTISASAAPQEQADWSQTDTAAVDFIKNKPDLSVYATKGELTSGLASKQGNLTPGVGITIEDNVISATAAQQQQADWAQTNTSAVDFIKNKPELSVYATESSVETALSGKQDTLTAGDNITIEGNVISASAAPQEQADWTQTDTAAVDFIKNKPDLATVATSGSYNDLSNKPTIPAAQVQSDWNESDSSAVDFIKNKPALATVATSGSYNDLSNTPDLSGYATTTQLEGKQDILTAGENITITNNVISATGGGTAQVNSDWDATSGVAEILHKPNLATVATSGSYNDLSNKPTETTLVAGNNITITESGNTLTISASGGGSGTQVNSDWDATSGVAEILNKPTEITLVAGTNVTITESGSTLTISATGGTQVNADWDATSGVAEILNKPDLSGYATTQDLANKQDTLTAGDNITITNNVISASAAPQVNSDWDANSGVAEILNKPDLVDIVAGPGIVVDNPDGNTLRVSVARDVETVLYEDTNYTYGRSSVTLSEDYRNFECVKIFTSKGDIQFIYPGNAQGVAIFALTHMTANYLWIVPWTFQSDGVTYSGATGKMWTVGTTTYLDVPSNAESNRWIQPTKIVGIHRIAGGN